MPPVATNNKLPIIHDQPTLTHVHARIPNLHPAFQKTLLAVVGDAMRRAISDISELSSHKDKWPVISEKDSKFDLSSTSHRPVAEMVTPFAPNMFQTTQGMGCA